MENRAAVTGGGGYVGAKLCEELVRRGYTVTALDVQFGSTVLKNPWIKNIKCDVRDFKVLLSSLQEAEVSIVFHVASYGMSGRDMLNRKMIEEVNVQGTRNVVEACIEVGIERLVYTSTYNVVFGGQEIRNGDSSLPYLPLDRHVDHYSRTKSTAEQEVLKSSGRSLVTKAQGGRVFKTCALRCAGIYGEGEQRHLPRIVSYVEAGLVKMTYGSQDSLVDFLHGDNFCQAHIKAGEAMLTHDSPVNGKAYFISDGRPINNFVFFKPLIEGLGYSYPTVRLPLWLVFYTAYLIELLYSIVARYLYNFQPLLTRAEVYKTGVTHYFSMDEARRDFGYSPEERDLRGVVQWFRERGHGRTQTTAHTKCEEKSPLHKWLVRLVLVLFVFLLFMAYISEVH